ncbi:hypothetical protein K438DRAFT_1765243 [Mycena galopus ATCC 62051]|nr:hypothetical protein K438DRAFT_1765243 [Mycena galopus ATCC 62051]
MSSTKASRVRMKTRKDSKYNIQREKSKIKRWRAVRSFKGGVATETRIYCTTTNSALRAYREKDHRRTTTRLKVSARGADDSLRRQTTSQEREKNQTKRSQGRAKESKGKGPEARSRDVQAGQGYNVTRSWPGMQGRSRV